MQAHPQKFRFVENPGKIPENLAKNGAQPCLTSKMAPNICRKINEDLFLEVTPNKGIYISLCKKSCRQKLHKNVRASLGKFGQKFLALPKICLLLHLCMDQYT